MVSIINEKVFVIMPVVIVSCHYAYDVDSGLSPHVLGDKPNKCRNGWCGTGGDGRREAHNYAPNLNHQHRDQAGLYPTSSLSPLSQAPCN